jgi:hypothetical protein
MYNKLKATTMAIKLPKNHDTIVNEICHPKK